MTTLNVNTIKPAGATLNLGESGDSVVFADDVKVNTVKDAGGNTLWVSNGSGVLSSVKAGVGGADKLLATTTVSSAVANIAFTSDIDSSYKEYVFKFINIRPVTDAVNFTFQCSIDAGSNYNVTTTTTVFRAYQFENDAVQAVSYDAGSDQAQGTAYQMIGKGLGNPTKSGYSGELHLFNPASTTYVKNFYQTANFYRLDSGVSYPETNNWFAAGYFNDTNDINAISFKMSSGNIAAGIIKMYGIAS